MGHSLQHAYLPLWYGTWKYKKLLEITDTYLTLWSTHINYESTKFEKDGTIGGRRALDEGHKVWYGKTIMNAIPQVRRNNNAV